MRRQQLAPEAAEASGAIADVPPNVLDMRLRDEATARLLREAVGDCGDLRGRLDLAGQKCLLVASSGGHIAQLNWLAGGAGVHEDSLWVSFRTPQTEALLAGRRVEWLDYVPPRRRADFVARLLGEVVSPGGRLVVGVFNEEKDRDTVADTLRSWGFTVAGATSRAHRDPRLRYKAVWVDA